MSNTNVYVEDENIKVSKSNFSIYPNEMIKYEGRSIKIKVPDLMLMLQRRHDVIDALAYEILNTIYTLQFCTSRQITEYLNLVKTIAVEQSVVSKKLYSFNKLSIISQYCFVSDENIEGTNMKIYTLDNNGKVLLKGQGYKCDWKYTDILDTIHIKSYLIRNQYILKLYKECTNIDSIKFKPINTGIGAIYSVNKINHILIPIRRSPNYKNELISTYEKMKTDPDILKLTNKKILFIGEDAPHIFDIYKTIYKSINKDTYFISDLKLFDRNLQKAFIRISVNIENGKANAIMNEEILSDFN